MNTVNEPLNKQRLLNNSQDAINKWAQRHCLHFIDQLTEKLFNLANQAESNQQQQLYFNHQKLISSQKESINSGFCKHLNNAFSLYKQHQATSTDFYLEEQQQEPLTLIDNDTLEQSLAIKTMTMKANIAFADELFALNQRFSVLAGGQKIADHGNPIAPGVFSAAIQEAINAIVLDNSIRLFILKLFDLLFLSKLKSLYSLLNQHFKNKGLLTNLSNSHEQKRDQQPDEGLDTLEKQASIDHQITLFNTIVKLQSELARLRPVPVKPNQQRISLEQLITAIQQLQQKALNTLNTYTDDDKTLVEHSQHYRENLQKQANNANEIDQHIIEIVGLLFEYMLNDERLPHSVKTLLSYLHTPFLKIAVLDKDFFNHPQHPARQLLNTLVASGERWVEPASKQKSEVFLKIETVVERILNDSTLDLRLFTELGFDFNRYLRQYARKVRLTEERAMQAAQGENKLKEIRLKINAYIDKKVAGIKLPSFIETLLYNPWANYLSFNLLRFGSNSGQWQHATTVVDDILWFVQISQFSSQPEKSARYQELLNSLPQAIEQGFETIGYHHQEQDIVDELRQLSVKTTADNSDTRPHNPPKQIEHEFTPITDITTHIDDVDIEVQLYNDTKDDAIIASLKQTEFGTWFVFHADNPKQRQQLKLAWSNTRTLHFMFVNKLGLQVAVKTGQELAKEIRNGATTLLIEEAHKPFFEKALERVLKQIQHPPNTTQD